MAAAHFLKADARTAATGALISGACTVMGVHWVASTGGAGRITIKDGGASGTTMIDIDAPAQAEGGAMMFPDPGIKFDTDVHVSAITNVDGLTLVYHD